MLKPNQETSLEHFEQLCIDKLEQMRNHAYEILNKAGRFYKALPLKKWE